MLDDRAEHVDEVIRPALDRGAIVVCDRFEPSTLVYQGGGARARRRRGRAAEQWARGRRRTRCRDRARPRRRRSPSARSRRYRDRFERAGAEFHAAGARPRIASSRPAGAGWSSTPTGRPRRSPRGSGRSSQPFFRRHRPAWSPIVVGQERAGSAAPRAEARPVTRTCSSVRAVRASRSGARVRGAADRRRPTTSAAAGSCSAACIPTSSSSRRAAASYRVKEDVRDTHPARGGAGADRGRSPGADPVRGRAAARQPERVGQRDVEDDRGAAAAHDRAARHRRAPTISCRRSGSRCQRIDFDPVADDACAPRSNAKVCRADDAATAAGAVGRPARARPCAGRARSRRCAPRSPPRPTRVDGTGATAFALARGARRGGRPGRRRGDRSARRGAARASTPSWNDSATPTATRSGCGAGSRSGTSARRGARASTCCSKA